MERPKRAYKIVEQRRQQIGHTRFSIPLERSTILTPGQSFLIYRPTSTKGIHAKVSEHDQNILVTWKYVDDGVPADEPSSYSGRAINAQNFTRENGKTIRFQRVRFPRS